MRWVCLLTLLAAVGCGGDLFEKKSPVDFKTLPEVVVSAAQKKAPEVKFDNAMRKADGAYEVRGKTKQGKVVEVEVNEKGEVLAVE
jgi:hypothetical protein